MMMMTMTMTTTVPGTLLYLAPDPAPSAASDVFALGMTLLDVLFCDGDGDRLREWVLRDGRAAPDRADLERVRGDLERRAADVELAALVRRMLAPDSADRPTASAVAAALGDLLNVRTCYLCSCPEPRDRGLECGAAARHFACNECFSSHISRPEASLHGDNTDGGVKCCASDGEGCAATFTLQQAAQHAEPIAFRALLRHMDDRKTVARQGDFEEWTKQFMEEFAAKSENERSVLAAQQHVMELMNLRCPRCRQVFGDFSGCAALTCEYAGCDAYFCAFCLKDCGRDAHEHVKTCRLNPRPGEYHVRIEEWHEIMDTQRRKALQDYWGTLGEEVRDALAADASVSAVIRDLKLDGLLGATAFPQQMAQLRGMGFKDERAMRRALSEADGDVVKVIDGGWRG